MKKTLSPGVRRCPRQSNRGQQGASLIEALIVITLLVGCLGGALFLFRVYSTHWALLQDGRQEAWLYALRSCSGDDLGTVDNPEVYREIQGQALSGTEDICAGSPGCQQGQVLGLKAGGSADQSGEIGADVEWFRTRDGNEVSRSGRISFGQGGVWSNHFVAVTPTVHRSFTCNEKGGTKPLHLKGANVFKSVLGYVSGIFF